jgi:hypothetical protein
MTAEPWSDDDRPPPPKRWRWWHVATLVAVVLLAVGALVMFAFSEKLVGGWHDWQVRQFRNDILNGNLPPEALSDELLKRDDGLYLAQRLSEDPDPRVRAAVIDRLIARGTPAKKQEGRWVDHVHTTLEFGADQAMTRLLDDPDPTVRKKAIRAASSIQELLSFKEKLLNILQSGDIEERLIVCEYLAHWNGDAVLRTFADPRQSKEVRLAALRSADRYGWARVAEDEGGFVRTMKQVQAEGDPDLRQAATDALRHSRTAAPE